MRSRRSGRPAEAIPRPAQSSDGGRPGGQMQQRPAGAVDQGGRLIEFELPHVSFAQVELDSLLSCTDSSLREHRRRSVDPYDAPARCLSNRDRNAPVANGKLDQWPVSITGKRDVERDVSSDAHGPVPVSVRPGVVPARHSQQPTREAGAARPDFAEASLRTALDGHRSVRCRDDTRAGSVVELWGGERPRLVPATQRHDR